MTKNIIEVMNAMAPTTANNRGTAFPLASQPRPVIFPFLHSFPSQTPQALPCADPDIYALQS